jgi:hypothetical protein
VSSMAKVGDVVNHRGQWIVVAPTHCPKGHRLGPNQTLVGNVSCRGHGSGHTIWHCLECPVTELPTYGPALGSHCTVMDGPADVRVGLGAARDRQ